MVNNEGLLAGEKEGFWTRKRVWVILGFILFTAAVMRLYKLDKIAPPGLNQDEAANAWSAYCILKTGKEYFGESWPLFYV
jgi:hypothetical protein